MGLFNLTNEKIITLNCTMNQDRVSPKFLTKSITLKQREDGTVYFDKNLEQSFTLIGYEWSGAVYQNVTTTTGLDNKKSKEKTHRRGRVGGALIGTLLFPGVGTVIGAAVGTGKKTTGKSKRNKQEVIVQSQEEVLSPAILYLIDNTTNEEISLGIEVNTELDMKINDLYFEEEGEAETPTVDEQKSIVDLLKGYKELLDAGIMTQEEFDLKKKELLNL